MDGQFLEDHNKWPEPTRMELRVVIDSIVAENPGVYKTPEQVRGRADRLT
jgi:hypothetical protein